MTKKILVTPKSYYIIRDKMMPLLSNYEVVFNDTGHTLNETEMINLVEDVTGIIIGIDPLTDKVIENANHLKAIVKYGVGMDNIDIEAINKRNIKLDKTPGTNNISVAELTVALIFNVARNIASSVNNLKNNYWERIKGIEVTGKTLGLIGCGSIGKEVAKRAKGLFMKVIIYDPYFDDHDFLREHDINLVSFKIVIKESDFLSLHLPLNKETQDIISLKELKAMKSSSFLINTARGGLINEDDLLFALKNNEIAGAACDVFSKEPPGDHPLLKYDNFILTPHIAANTDEAVLRMATQATRNLLQMLNNEYK
jgi:D-3-phosphoglycerate dehydrogenase